MKKLLIVCSNILFMVFVTVYAANANAKSRALAKKDTIGHSGDRGGLDTGQSGGMDLRCVADDGFGSHFFAVKSSEAMPQAVPPYAATWSGQENICRTNVQNFQPNGTRNWTSLE